MSEATAERWAVVEVMGHRRYVGRVEEVTFCGAPMVRVHIPSYTETRTQTDYVEAGDPLFDASMIARAEHGSYARKARLVTTVHAAKVVDLGASSIFAISWCSEAFAQAHVSENYGLDDGQLRTEGPWQLVDQRPRALLVDASGDEDEVPF